MPYFNPIKQAFAENRVSVGCWLTLASPAVAETLAHCGFDWLVVDTEHAPNDAQQIVEQLRAIDAARVHGSHAAAAVRVTANDAALVKRAMDCGAQTIVFPSIDTVDDARRAVASVRFPSDGNAGTRGVAGLVRAGRYALDPSYVARANHDACVIAQVESAQAVENVAAIAAIDGIDCLFVGTADLAASLGHLGETSHPSVVSAVARIIDAGRYANKPVGIFATTSDEARRYRAAGVSFIALHSDVAWLTRGAQHALQSFNTHTA